MQFNVLGALEVLDSEGRPVEVGGTQPARCWRCCCWRPIASCRPTPSSIASGRRTRRDRRPARCRATSPVYAAPSIRSRRVTPIRRIEGHWRGRRVATDSTRAAPTSSTSSNSRSSPTAAETCSPATIPGVRVTCSAEALALWRGPALAEFSEHSWAHGATSRLDERRLRTFEDRIRADLLLGRHELVIGELTNLVAQNPLHEGVRELLAVALVPERAPGGGVAGDRRPSPAAG